MSLDPGDSLTKTKGNKPANPQPLLNKQMVQNVESSAAPNRQRCQPGVTMPVSWTEGGSVFDSGHKKAGAEHARTLRQLKEEHD
jgi:hypothetical protein